MSISMATCSLSAFISCSLSAYVYKACQLIQGENWFRTQIQLNIFILNKARKGRLTATLYKKPNFADPIGSHFQFFFSAVSGRNHWTRTEHQQKTKDEQTKSNYKRVSTRKRCSPSLFTRDSPQKEMSKPTTTTTLVKECFHPNTEQNVCSEKYQVILEHVDDIAHSHQYVSVSCYVPQSVLLSCYSIFPVLLEAPLTCSSRHSELRRPTTQQFITSLNFAILQQQRKIN